jgi:hypothetical protein
LIETRGRTPPSGADANTDGSASDRRQRRHQRLVRSLA